MIEKDHPLTKFADTLIGRVVRGWSTLVHISRPFSEPVAFLRTPQYFRGLMPSKKCVGQLQIDP
jgi:hypothetical protein